MFRAAVLVGHFQVDNTGCEWLGWLHNDSAESYVSQGVGGGGGVGRLNVWLRDSYPPAPSQGILVMSPLGPMVTVPTLMLPTHVPQITYGRPVIFEEGEAEKGMKEGRKCFLLFLALCDR